MKNSKNRVVASGPTSATSPTPLTPELLPSPSDELFAGAAHSRGCASGNTLAPASRGITLPWLTSVVGNRVSPVFRRLRGCLKSPIRQLRGCATPIGVRDASLLDGRTPPRFRVQLQVELRSSSKRCAAGLHLPGEHIRDSASNRGGRRSPVGLRHRLCLITERSCSLKV
jgi:hypothetical protein